MALKLNESMAWLINVNSKQNLSRGNRDFIADLVSEEARTIIKQYYFILHDIVESKKYSKILIEGTKAALRNLLVVMKDNLPYEISYTSYNK